MKDRFMALHTRMRQVIIVCVGGVGQFTGGAKALVEGYPKKKKNTEENNKR